MLYKLERDDDLGVVKIIETPTNQVIEMFILSSESQMNEAKALLKHLNMGGAFDGNTPAFFLK
jgi:hypothetical protein